MYLHLIFDTIMDPSTLQYVQSLSKDVQTSLDALQQAGSNGAADPARVDAHEKVLELARALEKPRDTILKLSFSVY